MDDYLFIISLMDLYQLIGKIKPQLYILRYTINANDIGGGYLKINYLIGNVVKHPIIMAN